MKTKKLLSQIKDQFRVSMNVNTNLEMKTG